MDIVQRNLFRLLRSGAFESVEQIEPMSLYKWTRLYQLALMHQVLPYAYKGVLQCGEQFFMRKTFKQQEEWQKAVDRISNMAQQESEKEEDDLLRPDHLTNPILNNRLQDILNSEDSDTCTRQLLLIIIRVVRHLLNEGMPVSQLLELGLFVKQNQNRIDYNMLREWIDRLRLEQMSQLEGEFLILLFGFEEHDLPFIQEKKDQTVEKIAQELIEFTHTRSQDWYFSQEAGSVFVHSGSSSAMFSHVRRSSRYFRYYPSEGITNFFASFVHSLSHIEE